MLRAVAPVCFASRILRLVSSGNRDDLVSRDSQGVTSSIVRQNLGWVPVLAAVNFDDEGAPTQ